MYKYMIKINLSLYYRQKINKLLVFYVNMNKSNKFIIIYKVAIPI